MAKQNVANTALGAAICRLIEQYQLEDFRLFNDGVVKGMVDPPIRVMLQFAGMRENAVKQMEGFNQGVYGLQVCRTRAVDDLVQTALERGLSQAVILGAGYDTRPYRLPQMAGIKVFEVDLPSPQAKKKEKLIKLLRRLPENVSFIPADFEIQDPSSIFQASAFNPHQPALFLFEGVSQYLSEKAARQIFSFIGKTSPGGILIFTYILKSVIERCDAPAVGENMADNMENINADWLFGLDPAGLEPYLKSFHLDLKKDIGKVDFEQKYLNPIGRSLVVADIERIALAEVG